MNKTLHRNERGQFVTVDMAAYELNLGITTTRRLAAESGAMIRIGRSLRIDLEKLVQYVRDEYGICCNCYE